MAAGLVPFGLSLALLVRAGLGLDPWDVLNQGVSKRIGLSLGQVLVRLAGWALGGQVGVGTALVALAIGPLVARCLPPLRIAPRKDRRLA